ncbi:MAG: hypothetical protein ACI8P0_005914 [Planctomycetaceae bacterium]|jgi:hypothetical protein
MSDETSDSPAVVQQRRPRNGWKTAFFCLLGLNIIAFSGIVMTLVPAVRQAHEAARRSQCYGNLRKLAQATADYVSENRKYPPAFVSNDAGKPLYSWRVLLLPYLGEEKLYRSFDLSEPWDSPHNLKLLEEIPPVYVCPDQMEQSQKTFATAYAAVVAPDHVFIGDRGVSPMTITDSLPSTLLYVEASGANIPWTAPFDVKEASFSREHGCSSEHRSCVLAVTCAGSVRSISINLLPEVFRALFTRNGNERVGEF